jgi:translation initiation factor 3 subunit I
VNGTGICYVLRLPTFAVDSGRLFTASADQTVRMWDLQSGKELFQFKQLEPCRAVSLSIGEGMLAFTTDAFMGTQPMIHVAKIEQDINQQSSKSILSIEAPKGRITRVFWSELNRVLVTSHDGGFLRKWDSEVGGLIILRSSA